MQTFSPFYTHKFRGKSRPAAPLPKIETQESSVDVSLLDVMAIEDFLSHLKTKTENNWKELWKDSCVLAEQLKASRELLSIGSNLLSHKASRKILDRLIEVARVLLSAERVAIMELDINAQELVVTHALDEKLLGLRTPISSGIEGDVVSKCSTANVADVHGDPRYVPSLEPKGSNRVKCMVCAPIVSDGIAVGAIVAINKVVPNHLKLRSPRTESPASSFSPNEALLLVFIAANVGLALRQSLISKSLSSQVLERHLDFSLAKKLYKKLEGDSSLQKLVDLLYNRLDAERVSIFTYNPSSRSLICAVSQDIKGISIPQDKGLAGLSFTAMRIINVADARQDSRHFKDVDNSVGFTTRNLLCAPIVTQEGVALGVIQAVNKKSGNSFTAVDEQQMNEVCNMMVALVKEQAAESKSADNSCMDNSSASSSNVSQQQYLALTRAVGKMALASNLGELVVQLENIILPNTDFDLVRVYCVDKDKLVRITTLSNDLQSISSDTQVLQTKIPDFLDHVDPSEVYKIAELSVQMKQVLQFGAPTEYRYTSESSKLLANLQMQQGIIIPVQAKGYCFHPGNCVMIVGHSTRDDVMTDHNRMTIDTVADIFNSTLASIFERSSYEESIRQLRRQYHVLNSTLGSLEDFVIILNGEGSLLGSNKHVEELLGLQTLSSEAIGLSEKKRNPKSGKSSPTPALDPSTGQICEGMHYSQWLTPANSPELCRDISNAIHLCESRSSDSARLTSSIYPEGISVDYSVTAIGNPDHVIRDEKNRFLTPSVAKASESFYNVPHATTEVDSNNLIVVIIIHINKRKVIEIEEAVPSVTPMKPNTLEVRSASNGVDTATSILGAIRANYVLDPDMEANIKKIMESLVHTSRKMSISQSNFSAISLAVHAANCMLVNPVIDHPDNIFEWEFDVLKIKDSLVLCNIIGKFFESLFDFEALHIDTTTLARYIAEVGRHYHDRPFHNIQHATCVTHFSFMLIRTSNAIDNLKHHQVFGILVSAVVHDVDHPGNTNLFEINSGSELAIRYNDQSVLENHHCSTAFRIMRKPHMQLLSTVSKQIATEIRKTIISCVMATDMAVHFELIDETKKRAVNGWNFDEVKDQALLGKILLHAADLSNPVRPFHMTKEWARRISLEFNDQVEREQALGMPVLGFMMTPDEKAFCKNETGFASFVVAPMWRALAMCYPELNFLVEQLDNNLITWKARLEEIQAEEAAAAAAAGEMDSTK